MSDITATFEVVSPFPRRHYLRCKTSYTCTNQLSTSIKRRHMLSNSQGEDILPTTVYRTTITTKPIVGDYQFYTETISISTSSYHHSCCYPANEAKFKREQYKASIRNMFNTRVLSKCNFDCIRHVLK